MPGSASSSSSGTTQPPLPAGEEGAPRPRRSAARRRAYVSAKRRSTSSCQLIPQLRQLRERALEVFPLHGQLREPLPLLRELLGGERVDLAKRFPPPLEALDLRRAAPPPSSSAIASGARALRQSPEDLLALAPQPGRLHLRPPPAAQRPLPPLGATRPRARRSARSSSPSSPRTAPPASTRAPSGSLEPAGGSSRTPRAPIAMRSAVSARSFERSHARDDSSTRLPDSTPLAQRHVARGVLTRTASTPSL